MPTATLQSLADKAGVSLKDAENLWDKAKAAAKEKGFNPDDDRYWSYVVGVVKNMLGVETVDLIRLGWNSKVLSESIENIHDTKEGNYIYGKRLALNMRLLFNEYLGALSENTGLRALLLGESKTCSMPSVLHQIRESKSIEDLIDVYHSVLGDIDTGVLREVLSA